MLATMNKIVSWRQLCEVIEPHYPKVGNGRPPVGLKRMLRMYFVQHWFNLADESCEEALLDSAALRRFVGIDLGRERVPRRHDAAAVSSAAGGPRAGPTIVGLQEGALPRTGEERHALVRGSGAGQQLSGKAPTVWTGVCISGAPIATCGDHIAVNRHFAAPKSRRILGFAHHPYWMIYPKIKFEFAVLGIDVGY